mmetsp:Transcript_125066/g.296742  ORF Transcript_125066/g.296742 Transcript_125066/m.296742 type:complete len:249 (-) Transcript_125066:371-1117(-)
MDQGSGDGGGEARGEGPEGGGAAPHQPGHGALPLLSGLLRAAAAGPHGGHGAHLPGPAGRAQPGPGGPRGGELLLGPLHAKEAEALLLPGPVAGHAGALPPHGGRRQPGLPDIAAAGVRGGGTWGGVQLPSEPSALGAMRFAGGGLLPRDEAQPGGIGLRPCAAPAGPAELAAGAAEGHRGQRRAGERAGGVDQAGTADLHEVPSHEDLGDMSPAAEQPSLRLGGHGHWRLRLHRGDPQDQVGRRSVF